MPATTSLRAAYAKQVLHRDIMSRFLSRNPDHHPSKGLPEPPKATPVDRDVRSDRICIVGAGTCGLYLAMMLKYLGFTNVDILEANDNVGGRCFTWPKTENPQNGQVDHFYYDVGAMRIPPLPWMAGTISFIQNTLKLQTPPYYYDNPTGPVPVSYWYKNIAINDGAFDALMSSLASEFLQADANFDKAFQDWLTAIPDPTYRNASTAPLIFRDNYSTRAWLMNKVTPTVWTYSDTAKAELYDTSTGLFDQSLTETVIDYADFKNESVKDQKWLRVEGGMQLVPETIANLLASSSWPPPPNGPEPPASWNVQLKTPVTGYSFDPTSGVVSVTSSAGTKAYDMVFNTTAMGPLQRMDLSGLNLPNNILDGIRSLSYDRATKVAIKFTEAWWTTKYNIVGGVSSSDLPISNVVYPSWTDNDGTTPAVLMVSYSWAQDATRMGSMVADYTVPGVVRTRDDPLVTLCLNDLVQLFKYSTPALTFQELYDMVVPDSKSDEFGPYHAWAWSHDPWTGGAFALFGPGQFQNVYGQFQTLFCKDESATPECHFAMAGEALSAHHAWICGAFDSAYTTLCTWLGAVGADNLVNNLKASEFGDGAGQHVQEWDDKLFGWVAHLSGREEAQETKKLVVGTAKPQEA
ncbi:hypothetical protein QBC47DRAFT_401525 [Echria macrotheca]|uniref:Amine oxidase domain-containing protein n=1 Tax=Echria macrotheca TaxID=438768 RepID=A0AAJ0BE48_9PEZI|nr:hypothetical protein QBC47DRAFT_401525 [Echria macrotheca]